MNERLVSRLKAAYSDGGMSRREFLRSATLVGMGAVAAYSFIGSPLPVAAQENPRRGGKIRLGNQVNELGDPHAMRNMISAVVARPVFDQLTYTDVDNITRPALLEGWEASDDLRSWKLRVRKDVKWANGRTLISDDIVWNLKRVLDPAIGSSVLGLMQSYMLSEAPVDPAKPEGERKSELWDANAVERLDEFTVVLNLKEPQLAVPEHLFHYPLVIQDPEEGGSFHVNVNSTGPFDLVEHEVGRRALYKARPSYWGDGPYLDEYEIVHLPDDPNAHVGIISTRQIDGLYQANSANVAALNTISHLRFYGIDTATTMVARGHTTIEPFNKVKVRQALKLAVNQAEVAAVSSYEGSAAEHTHVAPVHPEYFPLQPFSQDVEKARQLLAEAGYPEGLKLEMVAPADETWLLNAAQVMVEHWKQAGINVSITVLPGPVYWENWLEHPFSITNWNHRPLGTMVLRLAYSTGAPWNESKYSNPELDKYLSEAEATIDVERRRQIMEKIETIMQEDGPIVQPFWTKIFTFWSDQVGGFEMHPAFHIFPNHLYLKA